MTLGQWFGHWLGDWFGPLEAAPEGSIAGSATITIGATGAATAIGHMAGSASVTVGGSGALTGIAEASGTATVTISGTGTLTDAGGVAPDTRLDQILAILMGRKVYDSTTGLWRVYDSNGVELADPGGILLRGLHGWLLQQATMLADVAQEDASRYGGGRLYPGRKIDDYDDHRKIHDQWSDLAGLVEYSHQENSASGTIRAQQYDVDISKVIPPNEIARRTAWQERAHLLLMMAVLDDDD